MFRGLPYPKYPLMKAEMTRRCVTTLRGRIYIAVTKNVPDRSAEGRSARTRPVRSDRQTHRYAALLLDRGLSSQTLMLAGNQRR